MSRIEARTTDEGHDALGFWATLAKSALQSADMMTGGISSHFDDAAQHRGLGLHAEDAYARVERAMTRVRTDAARLVAAGADKAAETQSQRLQPMGVADSFYMAHLDRAGPPRTEPNSFRTAAAADVPRFSRMTAREVSDSVQDGAREIARRTVREAIASIRAARAQIGDMGKFVDGAQVRALGDGAPNAFARAARRMVQIGLVAGIAATFVPHEAQAWTFRGNGQGAQGGQQAPQGRPDWQAGQVRAQFPRPVMVRPTAPPVVVNRTVQVYPNGGGNGWNGNGNGNGWNGNGDWVARRPVAAGVVAGVVAGAVIGSSLNGGVAPYGGTSYGGYAGQGAYGAYGAYGAGGYAGGGYAPSVPPGDKILMAARLVTLEMTGSVAAADRRIDDMTAQGAACVRAGAGSCVVNGPGIHFDYRAGVYGVSFRGRDVAVQNAGGYHEIDHALLARAFEDAASVHSREMAGAYGQPGMRQAYRAAPDGQRLGALPQGDYYGRDRGQDAQGDWEEHVPAPMR